MNIGSGKDGLSLVSSTAAAAAIVKGSVGFEVANSQGVSIQRFRIEPVAYGIYVSPSGSTALVRSNLIVGGATGIAIFGEGGTVRDNALLQQTSVGVWLGGGSFPEPVHADVLNNRITGTGTANSVGVFIESGIVLGGSSSAVLFGNTISDHPLAGVSAHSSGPDPGSLLIKANTVFRNGEGLEVNYFAARVENNRVNGNSGNGIEVVAQDATFLSNNAKSNGGTDCLDHSSGGGTAGTANTWTGNYGLESSPVGICKP